MCPDSLVVGSCDVPDTYRRGTRVVRLGGTLIVVCGPRRQRPAVISVSTHHAADVNRGFYYELIKRTKSDLN